MNDNTVKILNHLVKNCEMGVETLSEVIKVVEDDGFKHQLEEQFQKYNLLLERSRDKLKEHGEEVKTVNAMELYMADMMIKMKTMTDKSASKFAEMVIQGVNMGIIELRKVVNNNPSADPDIMKIVEDLLKFQEYRLEDLKKYL